MTHLCLSIDVLTGTIQISKTIRKPQKEWSGAIQSIWLVKMAIVKRTQAAKKILAMADTVDACVYYRNMFIELLCLEENHGCIPIYCRTDNIALYVSVHSSTQILDKRLWIETAILCYTWKGWNHFYSVCPQCT